MNNYPEYVSIKGKQYKINTDFRIAIECSRVAEDEKIGDLERSLAVIYLLFGDDGIDNPQDYELLLKSAKKYLSCGKELDKKTNDKPNMDFIKDYDYIEASFMSDYHIDLSNKEMHWWKFFNLLEGLSNSDMGNCCILNRIRNFRDFDISQIKDPKERRKAKEMQDLIALDKKEVHLTAEQEASMERLNKILGL